MNDRFRQRDDRPSVAGRPRCVAVRLWSLGAAKRCAEKRVASAASSVTAHDPFPSSFLGALPTPLLYDR